MNRKLRGLIESAIHQILTELRWEGYEAEDLEATCKYCHQDLWLVWEESNPMHKWTECGGLGEGSCEARMKYDPKDLPDSVFEPPDAPPPTLRSPVHGGESTKLKRST